MRFNWLDISCDNQTYTSGRLSSKIFYLKKNKKFKRVVWRIKKYAPHAHLFVFKKDSRHEGPLNKANTFVTDLSVNVEKLVVSPCCTKIYLFVGE